jgi:hypothetical protein
LRTTRFGLGASRALNNFLMACFLLPVRNLY